MRSRGFSIASPLRTHMIRALHDNMPVKVFASYRRERSRCEGTHLHWVGYKNAHTGLYEAYFFAGGFSITAALAASPLFRAKKLITR